MASIRLRPITMKDADICCRWVSNPRVHKHLGLLHPVRTVQQERSWIASILTDKQHQRSFVIENEERRPIGTCGLRGIDADNGTAFFGLMIGEPELWGRGYGTAAACALLKFGFRELGLQEIRLSCHRSNRRALRCYEKVGFRSSSHQPDQAQFGDREIRMAMNRDEWLAHARKSTASPTEASPRRPRSGLTASDT